MTELRRRKDFREKHRQQERSLRDLRRHSRAEVADSLTDATATLRKRRISSRRLGTARPTSRQSGVHVAAGECKIFNLDNSQEATQTRYHRSTPPLWNGRPVQC